MLEVLIILRDAIVAIALSWLGLGEDSKTTEHAEKVSAPSSASLFIR